jgi:hypothetical protein
MAWLLVFSDSSIEMKARKKTAGGAGGLVEIGFALFSYAQNSLPPAALENQK